MASVEAEGNSIDEAIESALRQLGTTRDRVEIEILANAARRLFGIGSRKARVRATLRGLLDTAVSGGQAPEPVRPTQESAPVPAGNHRVAERAQQILQEIINRLGVSAGVAVEDDGEEIVLGLAGDASGVLIGRRGQMLDALEYVVNRIVARDEGGSARVIVDSQNYRARRREALEEMARRMGQQAKKRGKPVSLNPMSPRDRRIVHLILQADSSLTTRSSGKGYFRKLIILPTGGGKVARGDG